MTDEEIRQAREEHMKCRGILRFNRSKYSRADVRRFVKHIKSTGFYDYHTANGNVVLLFKSPEQKARLMGQLEINTKKWQEFKLSGK